MPRLIDRIRSERAFQMPVWVAPYFEKAWERQVHNLMPLIEDPQLPVLLIDNVADYYYFGSDQEYWDLKHDFPNLAPPFPAFWAEHRMVTRIHSKDAGDTDMSSLVGHNGKIGALVHAIDPADATFDHGDGPPEGTRWILWCELFIDYGNRTDRPTGPHGSTFLCIDAEGRCLDRPWMRGFASDSDADSMRALMTYFYPTLLTICFLHCKNVEVAEERVDKPLAKKYHAKTGKWPVRYKTLVIEPLKKILRHQGNSDSVGVAKAMHICRGHFRDYREGRGLFGKYKQLVWTPMTVRGTRGKQAPPAREIEVRI
jgi:hypothetical protein